MTAIPHSQRIAEPARREGAPHQFKVGQTVRLRGGYTSFTSRCGDIYRITGTLPPIGNSPQYRIRNEGEQYERVTTEDSLEAMDTAGPGEGSTLLTRTFG
ncbi:hypothetical protein MKI84_10425 [Ancylobacter sp. A5.8]|uniref:hypothetical protein n=1 Tax=Ancylobacter gelatini TaxID=2919920 RepID=UPI001F4EEBBB|nr:hypothetical protein [Ancylobacter gelatini]MCJ8143332.1 hypothetical protein [Ancylobacter gelatini]